jgi:polyhydroxyalkanoate synthesis regulator phasin
MAIKLPSFKVFSVTSAKSRMLLLLGAVVAVSVALFFGFKYLNPSSSTVGASRVANAPAGLQSVPGSKLAPEYYRALMQANAQTAQQAQITGGSALPTLVNIPTAQPSSASGFVQNTGQNCTVLCPSPDKVNVTSDINELFKSSKISQKEASMLANVIKSNATVDEFTALLNPLVKSGKLTPEQSRKLVEQYRKQHDAAVLNEAARPMDAMIQSGQLSIEAANQLLEVQKKLNGLAALPGVNTPAMYAKELDRLVKEGKITPQAAALLLAQYTQQRAREATKQGLYEIRKLAAGGAITSDVANQLADMQTKNVPVDQYAATLQRLVAEGKITPAEAARLLASYKERRATVGGTTATLDDLIEQQVEECQNEINQIKKSTGAAPKTPPKACQKVMELKAAAQKLAALQANNASVTAYAEELKRAVQNGSITPEDAATLLQFYQASVTPVNAGVGTGPSVNTTLPTSSDFAKLQQAVQNQEAKQVTTTVTPTGQSAEQAAQFAAAQAQSDQQAQQDREKRIQQIQGAMGNQAQYLINSVWVPKKMTHVQGSATVTKTTTTTMNGNRNPNGANAGGLNGNTDASGARPLIKSGTIYFAVLDTAVDSDYPDTPVMATIVQGPYKGAKLLGKLSLANGKDKVSLSFTLMDQEAWNKTKTVNAFAIDPDTARTVMASSVDHHYLMRYGSLFAASFLTGFAQGISNAGSSTTGIFGTSSVHPNLSFGKNVAVALGQVGTNFTSVVQGYVNTPSTVKVNSGVGLGILFMSDVT